MSYYSTVYKSLLFILKGALKGNWPMKLLFRILPQCGRPGHCCFNTSVRMKPKLGSMLSRDMRYEFQVCSPAQTPLVTVASETRTVAQSGSHTIFRGRSHISQGLQLQSTFWNLQESQREGGQDIIIERERERRERVRGIYHSFQTCSVLSIARTLVRGGGF